MKCSPLNLDGLRVIVCGPKRIKACCKCGAIATRECDRKMRKLPSGRLGTCDRGPVRQLHLLSGAPRPINTGVESKVPKFQYCLRSVYGTFKHYPINQVAHQFADLLGNKTFTVTELNQIQKLGFELDQVADPVATAAAQVEVRV